ncbi:MAG: alpha/beta hydrolase [Kofleriaceae bacterium]|nr:alpha/beta hydrolase [Kofleriaceae bacterium]
MKWSVEQGLSVRRTGAGPRIVWIHGLGESSVSFEPVLAKLPGYEHVLVDMPGYGRATWPDAPLGLPALADHLAAWLPADSVVIGHSMGGVLATLIAERTRVRGVVDIDGNLTRGDCTFSAQAQAYSEDEFVAHGFAAMRAKVYADGATRPELRTYHAAMCFASPQVFHRHACELVEMSSAGTLGAQLAALAVPKLFVAGVPDGICAESRALLDRLGVRWAGIEPAGHWVYLDQLERFVAEVDRFMQSL